MGKDCERSISERWAEFRFSVVGALLASPPAPGERQTVFRELALKVWRHPITGAETRYGYSTIERWFYQARKERGSPVVALRKKVRKDKGEARLVDEELAALIAVQHTDHPAWSYQLHADNIRAALKQRCEKRAMPSYECIRRYMQAQGLFKQRRRSHGRRPLVYSGQEVRSFEVAYVGGLWHLDFHHCSRRVLTESGEQAPICLAVMDDHSRVMCHIQWYLQEDTRCLVHGFSQAIQKRGLPRSLLSDNGAAMLSAEFREGLLRLGIVHETILPGAPYQNAKQERVFSLVEGRFIAMLDGVKDLTLKQLNDATIAWAEMEYNRAHNRELGTAPYERFKNSSSVLRQAPASELLRDVFRREVRRRQRQTDGSVSIAGIRFEIPWRYRKLRDLWVRYAEWDLSYVHLVDRDNNKLLCRLYPVDKAANASQGRRAVVASSAEPAESAPGTMAPLLEELMAAYAATGLPPAYLPDNQPSKKKEK